jgi:hypothetical protein
MKSIQELFSELDGHARQVSQIKNLLADLAFRPHMGDDDKIRLAKAFIQETKDTLNEMHYIVSMFKDNKPKVEVL